MKDSRERMSHIADLRIRECFRVAVCASRQELESVSAWPDLSNQLTFHQSPGRKL
jgi:hypothetical protein